MARDLKKEYGWEKNKYYYVRAKIPRSMGDELAEKVKRDNKTISSVVRDAIEKYLSDTKKV